MFDSVRSSNWGLANYSWATLCTGVLIAVITVTGDATFCHSTVCVCHYPGCPDTEEVLPR